MDTMNIDNLTVVYHAKNPLTNEKHELELLAWQVIKCPEGLPFIECLLKKNQFIHIPSCISQGSMRGMDEYVMVKR